jgi:hypothetical protein
MSTEGERALRPSLRTSVVSRRSNERSRRRHEDMVLNVGRLENSCLTRFLHLADEMLLAHALLQWRHDELFTTR